jgi:selenide,water dikinase
MSEIKLTQYSHGGGCGCKIAPALLSQILGEVSKAAAFPDLLVGSETSDDAAVYRLNDSQAIVATTDFFMPIVDDPYDFGRIAATNALSDIYAMGARPILALAVVGMPVDKLPVEVIRRILEGGSSVCAAAGIPIAGGHSIDAPEPIYGLAALGVIHPAQVKRNDQAKAGDRLILGKPLGVGIMSAALKKGRLAPDAYGQMVATTTQLNTPGTLLAEMPGVHAMTDVTGFGLLGHLLEICRGSRLAARVEWARVPILPGVAALVMAGFAPGAADRNWASYGHEVRLPHGFADWQRKILCDPQTSGGLLVACAAEAVADVLATFAREGFTAAEIGTLEAGEAKVEVV